MDALKQTLLLILVSLGMVSGSARVRADVPVLDSGFGAGQGWVSTAVGAYDDEDIARSMLPLAYGKFIVAGSSHIGNKYYFIVLRYLADGTLDTSFGNGGKVATSIGTGDDEANVVIRQSDGKLVAAGYSWNGTNKDFALVRYNGNGTLDKTFGKAGKVTTAIGSGDDEIFGLVQLGSGKLVAVGRSASGSNGSIAIVRYNGNGTLDTSFDTDGKLTVAPGSDNAALAVIQQADLKLVVAGYTTSNSNHHVVLLRYNTDGTADTTFDSDGSVTTVVGTADEAHALIQQTDGKLVIAGFANSGNNDMLLVRYNLDGSLDTSLDADGVVTTSIDALDDKAYSLAQQRDGKLVVAGYSWNGSKNNFALVRYNSNGALDPTFSNDGKLTTAVKLADDKAFAVLQTAEGSLLAAGYSSNSVNKDIALVRYNPDGSLDTSLDGDGIETTVFGGSTEDRAYALLQQADGHLVAAGYSTLTFRNFSAVRYNLDGSLDTSFHGDGKVLTEIGGAGDEAHAAIQQSDGKLVLAGFSYNGTDNDIALVRYNPDGSLDTTFGNAGIVTTAVGSGDDEAYALIQQANGKLVIAGRSYNGSNNDVVLARYNTDGLLDATFGMGGLVVTPVGSGNDEARALLLESDGKLLVAGYSNNGTDKDVLLLRYTANGALDPGFDGDGIVTTAVGTGDDEAYGVMQQVDDQLVVVGASSNSANKQITVLRYNLDGSLDTSFNSTGKVSAPIGTQDYGYAVVQQVDGKLLVAGRSYNGSNQDIALLRFHSNGAIDTAFGTVGKYVLDPLGQNEEAHAIIQQQDGKMLVAGFRQNQSTLPNTFLLARLMTDTDGDGHLENADVFPLDATEWADTDGDGVGDNADAFPLDPTEWLDSDHDGVGDNADAFPFDPTEWLDTDGDGIGNNADTDDDNDNLPDSEDPYPLDALLLNDRKGLMAGSASGAAVALGDINGDGYADLIIGSPQESVLLAGVVTKHVGVIRIISGKNGVLLNQLTGSMANEQFGAAIAVVPDQDADGHPDLLLGFPTANILGASLMKAAGRVGIYSSSTGQAINATLGSGTAAGDHYGAAVAVGDLNNDGTPDLVIGAPQVNLVLNSTTVLKHAGQVTVLNGSNFTQLYTRDGAQTGAQFGAGLAVDAIHHQLLVGSPLCDVLAATKLVDAGCVDVFAGANGTSAALLTVTGQASGDHFGAAISYAAVDVDGDGQEEWAVGAPGVDVVASVGSKTVKRSNAGRVLVFSGWSGTPVLAIDGAHAGDNFGSAVNWSGDSNHDSVPDLLVGAPKETVTNSVSGKTIKLSAAGYTEDLSGARVF